MSLALKVLRNLRPLYAVLGFAIAILLFDWVASGLGIRQISSWLGFLPRWFIMAVGVLFILLWVPIFVGGLRTLGHKVATGYGEHLVANGIFRYVRNPMYSGFALTLFGIGLLTNLTGAAIAPLLGLLIASRLAWQEEKTLTAKYGTEYTAYKQQTPMFFPRPGDFFKAVLGK